jgi:phosphopantothenoylcysteine decarboxylase / phosphopantothenate---cysteine ligase
VQGVFGGDANTVQLVSASGVEIWEKLSKQDVANRLMGRLATMLAEKK